jgi:hypothetical protein
MKTNDVFPSRWLKAEDLDTGDVTVTIRQVKLEKFEQQGKADEQKPAAYFDELDKALILNKTNWKMLVDLTQEDESDNWVGHRITLTVVDVDAFGDIVHAIRIKKPEMDHKTLVDRFQKLYEKAAGLGVENLDTFKVADDAADATIIEVGKLLRAAVQAAEAF